MKPAHMAPSVEPGRTRLPVNRTSNSGPNEAPIAANANIAWLSRLSEAYSARHNAQTA